MKFDSRFLIIMFFISTSALSDTYLVEITQHQSRIATMTVTLEPEGDVLLMNEEGVHGLPNGWATYVENLSVWDMNQNKLEVEPLSDSRWKIINYKAGKVTLNYQVILGHDKVNIKFGDNGAAYAMPDGVMWAGRALFIAGKPSSDVRVEFKLPSEWNISTPWLNLNDHTRIFTPFNTEDLQNSAFFAGLSYTFEVASNNSSLRIVLSGERTLAIKEGIEALIKKYFAYYEKTYQSSQESSMIMLSPRRREYSIEPNLQRRENVQENVREKCKDSCTKICTGNMYGKMYTKMYGEMYGNKYGKMY